MMYTMSDPADLVGRIQQLCNLVTKPELNNLYVEI